MKKIFKFIYVFLIIGLESLGNMSAVTVVLEENLVKKNNWVTEDEIIDAVAIGRLGPGAMTANVVSYLGYKIGGFWGGIAAGICYTICPLVIIAIIYGFLDSLLQYSFFVSFMKGFLVYICVILVDSVVKMGKSVLVGKFKIAIFVCAFIISILVKSSNVWIIIGAVVIGWIYSRRKIG